MVFGCKGTTANHPESIPRAIAGYHPPLGFAWQFVVGFGTIASPILEKFNKASELTAAGELDGAQKLLEELAAEHPEISEVHFNLGTIHNQREQWDAENPAGEGRDQATHSPAAAPNSGRLVCAPGSTAFSFYRRPQRKRRPQSCSNHTDDG